ncbi:MAG TPA: EAL domain-containing protein [Kineosporiaceae bacterium]|nr:EAL domain-containing protein [Kineosporiaceae bacterium]
MKQSEIDPGGLRSSTAAPPFAVSATGPDPNLARLVAEAGNDVDQVTELLVRACAGIPHELIVLLLTDPAVGGLQAARVRHQDERRAVVLQARLGVELRALNDVFDHAGRFGMALPIDGAALPEPVQAVLAEERPGPVMVVPVIGRLAILGVLVVSRGGTVAFTETELNHVLSAGQLCGQALENIRSAGDAARAGALVRMLRDAVITTDAMDVVTHWNEAAEEMYGISAAEATGHRIHDLIRNLFWEGDAGTARASVLNHGRWQGQVRQTSRVGRVLEVESQVSALRGPNGQFQGTIAVNRDVTAAVTARADAQAQSRAALELMDVLDAQAAVIDSVGRVTASNARWRSAAADRDRCVCGPVAEGENWLAALHSGTDPEAGALAVEVANLLRGRLNSVHTECGCPQGGIEVEIGIEVTRVEAGRGGAVVVQTPISRRPRHEELTHRATHDELTGLPNRAALMEGLSTSLKRMDGTGKLAVLFCDLDGFKDINDGLGHAVGDQVLVAVARRLRQRCRSADVVARFGGDEFVVVLSIDEAAQAVAMADRIVEVLDEPIVVGEIEVAPGVSVGITVVDVPPDDDDPVGTLLRDADTAMYHAKDRGRGRYELFDSSLRENIEERLELAAALRRAVGDGELEIAYQSRRYCGDRRVVGVEALLRWRHPDLGLIEPDVFIPIAERTGRIVELGNWVLQNALTEFAAVEDTRITLAVNVSTRQLVGGQLAHTVAAALAESGLEPHRLILEITESAFMDDPAAARSVLTDLNRLGVLIALDDFGTGWSLMQFLRTLPVDILKIDRTFVADLPTSLESCAVVSAVLNLGHGMGLVVVAEGVENEDILAVLRDMGCDEYQGFIDGGPGPLDEVLRQ